MKEQYHIVIMRFSSLGDVVLTTSLLSAIKLEFGNKVHLSFLTSEEFIPLLQGHPYIDSLWGHTRSRGVQNLIKLRNLVRAINKSKTISLFLDAHGTIRSIFVRLSFPHIPRYTFAKRTGKRFLLTLLKVNFLGKKSSYLPELRPGELLLQRYVRDLKEVLPLSKRYRDIMDDLKSRGLEEGQLSSCGVSFSNRSWTLAEKFLPFKEGSYICVVPSASYPKKRWKAENFLVLSEMILQKYPEMGVVVLAGPKDSFCTIFSTLEKRFPHFVNLQGKTSLVEAASILKHAHMCVGNDTGLPHIAESVGTKSFFILGPTGEEFGFYPHLYKSSMIGKRLWCRPCTTNGQGMCVRKKRYCLENISVGEVYRALVPMLPTKKLHTLRAPL